MRKFILPVLMMGIFLPQIVFAAWWNPLSWNVWKVFTKRSVEEVKVIEKATSTAKTVQPTKESSVTKVEKVELKGNVITPSKSVPSQQVIPEPERFIRPSEAPSSEQIKRLLWMCSYNAELEKQCENPKFTQGYFTNDDFRYLIDELIKSAQDKLSVQQAQNEAARQQYLNYLQYTRTQAPSSRYEVYVAPTVTLPSTLFPTNTIQPIKRKWEVRWEGQGIGTFIDSTGIETRFHCESSGCKPY